MPEFDIPYHMTVNKEEDPDKYSNTSAGNISKKNINGLLNFIGVSFNVYTRLWEHLCVDFEREILSSS